MATKRPRNAAQTRADVLSVAAALVIRYFGSKQDLFAPAADFTIKLPDLAVS
jgi:hypothetical protein